MFIRLPYGSEEVPIDVPDNWINGRCYRPHPIEACADMWAELAAALEELSEETRLGEIARGKNTCCIAVDGENMVVCEEILPALIEAVEDQTDLTRENITILVTNRALDPLTRQDVRQAIDEATRRNYRVVLHRPHSGEGIIDTGSKTSAGIPLYLNRHYVEAELKIILGGVRPDLLAGFTGGRSVVLPGMAGEATLAAMYSFEAVAHSASRPGNFVHNPFHIMGNEALNAVGCDLGVMAVINPAGEVHRVIAGQCVQAHMQAMNLLREKLIVPVKEPMDIVVTSGGGAPYDNDLLRVLQTICGVLPVLKPEGTIVLSAALRQGLGPSGFRELLKSHNGLHGTMEWLAQQNGQLIPGAWAVQRLFSILKDHEVILYNKDLEEDQIWSLGLTPSRDTNEAIHGAMESHGQRCKIVALPDGPFGIGEVTA